MRLRTTLLLAALTAALAAAYALLNVLPATRVRSTDELLLEGSAIFGGPAFRRGEGGRRLGLRDLVTRIVVRRNEEVIEMRRIAPPPAPEWRLVAPFQAPAAAGEVEQLCFALETLHALRRIDPEKGRPLDLAQYGLDDPPLSVTFALAGPGGEEKEWTLLVGRKEPLGRAVYVRRADQPTVYGVDARLIVRLTQPIGVFRDRRLLSFDPDAATALEVRYTESDRTTRCERAGERWRLTAPVEDLAQAGVVRQALVLLADLRVESEDFVGDAEAADAPIGLDAPQVSVSVEEGARRQTLEIGARAEGRPKRYARRAGEPGVFLAPEALLDRLHTLLRDVRSRRPLDFDPARVASVRLALPDGEVLLRAGPEGWRIEGPKPREADDTHVREFLKKLRDPTILGWADGADPTALRYSLDPPIARIEVAPLDGPPCALLIGAVSREAGVLYARRAEGGPILYLPAGLLAQELGGAMLHFLARRLLAFADTDAQRIVVAPREGPIFDLRREGKTWLLERPARVAADQRAVNAMLLETHLLFALRAVAREPTDLAPYGLDAPALRCAVTYADLRDPEGRATTREIQVGDRADDGSYYARRADDDVVFLVSSKAVEAMRQPFASRVVCQFLPEKAERIVVRVAGEEEVVFARQAAGAWRVERGQADASAALRILQTAFFLEAAAIEAYDRTSDEAFGLDRPRAEVTIELKGLSYPLRIGRTKGAEGAYLAVGAEGPLVYRISPDAVAALTMGRLATPNTTEETR